MKFFAVICATILASLMRNCQAAVHKFNIDDTNLPKFVSETFFNFLGAFYAINNAFTRVNFVFLHAEYFSDSQNTVRIPIPAHTISDGIGAVVFFPQISFSELALLVYYTVENSNMALMICRTSSKERYLLTTLEKLPKCLSALDCISFCNEKMFLEQHFNGIYVFGSSAADRWNFGISVHLVDGNLIGLPHTIGSLGDNFSARVINSNRKLGAEDLALLEDSRLADTQNIIVTVQNQMIDGEQLTRPVLYKPLGHRTGQRSNAFLSPIDAGKSLTFNLADVDSSGLLMFSVGKSLSQKLVFCWAINEKTSFEFRSSVYAFDEYFHTANAEMTERLWKDLCMDGELTNETVKRNAYVGKVNIFKKMRRKGRNTPHLSISVSLRYAYTTVAVSAERPHERPPRREEIRQRPGVELSERERREAERFMQIATEILQKRAEQVNAYALERHDRTRERFFRDLNTESERVFKKYPEFKSVESRLRGSLFSGKLFF